MGLFTNNVFDRTTLLFVRTNKILVFVRLMYDNDLVELLYNSRQDKYTLLKILNTKTNKSFLFKNNIEDMAVK